MHKRIIYSELAQRDLDALPVKTVDKIISLMDKLKSFDDPRTHSKVKFLSDGEFTDFWRMEVKDHRVVFDMTQNGQVVRSNTKLDKYKPLEIKVYLVRLRSVIYNTDIRHLRGN